MDHTITEINIHIGRALTDDEVRRIADMMMAMAGDDSQLDAIVAERQLTGGLIDADIEPVIRWRNVESNP